MSYRRLLGGLRSMGVAASLLALGAAPPAAAGKDDHFPRHRSGPTSLVIKKVVKTPDKRWFERGAGWDFSTTVTLPYANGKWLRPSFGDIAKGEPSTKTATTSKYGLANFMWFPKGKSTSDPVVVKETVKDGFETSLYCWSNDHKKDKWTKILKRSSVKKLQRRGGGKIEVQEIGNGQWDLGKLWRGQSVACLAKNTLTQLKLTKVVEGGAATAGDFQLTATPVEGDAGQHGSCCRPGRRSGEPGRQAHPGEGPEGHVHHREHS